jgi:hypothetical protein
MVDFDGTVDTLIANILNATSVRKVTIKLVEGERGQSDTGPGGFINVGGNCSNDAINFFPQQEFDPFGALALSNKKIEKISTIRLLGGMRTGSDYNFISSPQNMITDRNREESI